jgi:hypothetical protein
LKEEAIYKSAVLLRVEAIYKIAALLRVVVGVAALALLLEEAGGEGVLGGRG